MLTKYATATIIGAEIAQKNALGLVKASHRATFDYEPRSGFLYVRSRMISSRANDNHDEFPAEEIRKGWKTFIGKPVFVNHRNEDHRRMRGVIIDAVLHEDKLPGGGPDVWVEGLHEIDAQRFPKLAEAILSGRVNRTSMGTDVEHSVCSACDNKATTPAEYCQHIPRMKGKILYRHTAAGQREGHLIREKCYGLRFFENSFLVEDPADPTACVLGVDDRGIKTSAAKDIPWHDRPEGAPPAQTSYSIPFRDDKTSFTWTGEPSITEHDTEFGNCESCGTPARVRERLQYDRGEIPRLLCKHCMNDLGMHTRSGEGYINRKETGGLPETSAPLTPLPQSLNSKIADRQLSLFPQPKRTPKKKPSRTTTWSSDQPLSYEEIGNRHPSLYGEPEVHGEEAEYSDGWGIGDAANHLAFDRADDPDAESTSASDLTFHRETVDPKHIDYARHTRYGHDQRVQNAYEGYRDNPSQVPPLVLVHRHGMYQVADGHHRAEGAAKAGAKVRAYVAYSPFPDEPFSDGERAPFHGARKTRGNPPVTAVKDEGVYCDQGHEHDAPHGAAGMLIRHMGDDGNARYLLQKRSPWVDHPDTWAFPGGGLHDGESPVQGAYRETVEEMGGLPEGVKPTDLHTDDHGGWAFHTLMADAPHRFEPSGNDGEAAGHGWFTIDEMKKLPLHPGFKKNLKAVTSMRRQGGTHPDAACPACGSGEFNQIGNIGACQDCGETFDASKSMADNIANRQFAEHLQDERETEEKKQRGAFEHVTPNRTVPHPGSPPTLEGHMHDQLRPERIRQGPFGMYPRTPEQTRQRQELMLQRSKPYKVPEGPADVRHLSRKQAISDEEIHKGLGLPTSEQGHKDLVHEQAKGLADSLMAPLYEPYGGEENYHLHRQNEGMQDLHRRYEGGTGTFGFDEGGDPYYEISHRLPGGRHSGWQVRHYSDGPSAEIRHMATPDESHDLYDIGENTYHPEKGGFGQAAPPAQTFGHEHLEKLLNDWHDDQETGSRQHLEGPYGDARIRRFKARYPMGKPISKTSAKLAYGETKAPQEVDTLRTESCPVCGEQDSFDGERCMVCNFVQPPAMFQDPDTSVSKQMDLEKVPFDQGMVGPNGETVQGPPGDPTALEGQPMENVPGTPGDEIADLFCPACGFSADTQEPMTDNDPSMPAQQEGLVEGDVCPNCGKATLLSVQDVGQMGGDVPQEIAADANADGVPDEQEPGVEEGLDQQAEQGALPGEEGPATPDGNDQDVEAADPAQEGPAAELDENVDDEQTGAEAEDADRAEGAAGDDDADEDDEPAVENRKKAAKGRRAPATPSRETMTQPNQAATAESRKIAALEQIVAVQAAQLEVAGQQLQYLATMAGVGREFEAFRREGAKKIADIMNPAEPVPDPPGQAPSETTDEAATPETFDDPRRPGLTPGSTNGVPAQMTDTPLQPGVTIPTQPFTNLVDVTAPVEGTQTHVDPSQTKIETDVRVGDPMANADNPQGYGFPLTGPFAQDGAASVGTTTSPGAPVGGGRTMASIRLAKLRKAAGLHNEDDLVAGARIEATAELTDQMIAHEIHTLDKVVKSAQAASRTPRRTASAPRQPSPERQAPSLVGAPERGLSTVAAFEDDDASDLFLD